MPDSVPSTFNKIKKTQKEVSVRFIASFEVIIGEFSYLQVEGQ